MKVKIQKHSYVLHKISRNSNTQFNLIKKNIPMSIFSIISYQFFKKMIKKKIINLFVIKKKKRISCIITVITPNDFIKLKYNICFFFLKNPLIFFLNVPTIFKSLTRGSNPSHGNTFLHLLHLVVFKNTFKNLSLKKKDLIINFFFKTIVRIFNAKTLFLCYENSNLKAHKFYLRNKFKIFDKKKNIFFLKKNFGK